MKKHKTIIRRIPGPPGPTGYPGEPGKPGELKTGELVGIAVLSLVLGFIGGGFGALLVLL